MRFMNTFITNPNPNIPTEKMIDIELKHKIGTEHMFIHEFFQILVNYYKIYLKEGMIMPERYANDTNKYLKNNDPFGDWYNSNILYTNKSKDIIKASELYNNYIEYHEHNDKGLSQLDFKQSLSIVNVEQKRKNSGLYFIGVKIKDHINDDSDSDNDQ